MRVTLAVVLIALCLFAVVRIGVSVYDYQVQMMDLTAPTINIKPSPIPAPHHFRSDFPPVNATPFAPVPAAPCYADDACKARQVVFI